MTQIHPTAIIDASAKIGTDAEIGPYCIIGPNVEIGARTRLHSHVSVQGWTKIGEDCILHPFVALGEPPQDFKYKGGEVRLEIGDRNVLREQVTMHLGTPTARGMTRVGRAAISWWAPISPMTASSATTWCSPTTPRWAANPRWAIS